MNWMGVVSREDVRGKTALFTSWNDKEAPSVLNVTSHLFTAELDENLPKGHEITEEELANVELPAFSIDWQQVISKTWVAPEEEKRTLVDQQSITLNKTEYKK